MPKKKKVLKQGTTFCNVKVILNSGYIERFIRITPAQAKGIEERLSKEPRVKEILVLKYKIRKDNGNSADQ